MSTIVLQGITWGHSRGYTPLVAFSQRFSELHPGVEIIWQKRSLQEFADFPIEQLTRQYDLLIIDHPWVGTAAATESAATKLAAAGATTATAESGTAVDRNFWKEETATTAAPAAAKVTANSVEFTARDEHPLLETVWLHLWRTGVSPVND